MCRSWVVATRALMMRTRSPRSVVTTYRMRSWGDIAKVTVFSGCSMSSKSTESGSRMASAASSKETPCFFRFEAAFSASHSKSPEMTVATAGTVPPIFEGVEVHGRTPTVPVVVRGTRYLQLPTNATRCATRFAEARLGLLVDRGSSQYLSPSDQRQEACTRTRFFDDDQRAPIELCLELPKRGDYQQFKMRGQDVLRPNLDDAWTLGS